MDSPLDTVLVEDTRQWVIYDDSSHGGEVPRKAMLSSSAKWRREVTWSNICRIDQIRRAHTQTHNHFGKKTWVRKDQLKNHGISNTMLWFHVNSLSTVYCGGGTPTEVIACD